MDDKKFYLDAIKNFAENDNKNANDSIQKVFDDFMNLQHVYNSAMRTVETILDNYNDEFQANFQRSPIHEIDSRIKSPQSIIQKLQKKKLAVTVESAQKNLFDIAGIRVICEYIDDVFAVAHFLSSISKDNGNSTFKLCTIKNYISNPKPSGYRSLHIVVKVPVYTSTVVKYAYVEIQIRTIAMDFWASLEHHMKYKTNGAVPEDVAKELAECAETIAETDVKMQELFNKINGISKNEE